MTREQAKELLPVIQAYAEGKIIQIMSPAGWEDVRGSIVFDCIPQVYRIKPKPRDGWIPSYAVCASPDAASVLARSMIGTHLAQTAEVIHVREVME